MAKLKKNIDIILTSIVFVTFITFTLLVKYVGVEAIGPNGSEVGFASLNSVAHEFFGVNLTLYNLTDYAGFIPLAIILVFAIIGIYQWITRRHILKVDNEILALGIFYILVGIFYVFFEFVAINFRPVLIEGVLEKSYPSSSTLLSITVGVSAIFVVKKLIKNKLLKIILRVCLILLTTFITIGRVFSGVHWITDIIGGILLSSALILFYCFLLRILKTKFN